MAKKRGAKYPDPNLPWPIIMEGVRLIAEKETCFLTAYPDPISKGKPWTIGWGDTDNVAPGDVWAQDYADSRFCADLITRTAQVRAMCTVEPDEFELAALVSLAYNIGLRSDKPRKRGLYWSSVLKLHNAGDKNAAARAFLSYNRAAGPDGKLREVDGLTTRRMAEAALYLTPLEDEPMPQVVEPPPPLAMSPTVVTSGSVAGLGTVVAGASMVEPDTVSEWLQMLQRFGIQPAWALAGVLILAGLFVIHRRARQRSGGWV